MRAGLLEGRGGIKIRDGNWSSRVKAASSPAKVFHRELDHDDDRQPPKNGPAKVTHDGWGGVLVPFRRLIRARASQETGLEFAKLVKVAHEISVAGPPLPGQFLDAPVKNRDEKSRALIKISYPPASRRVSLNPLYFSPHIARARSLA
jgi:hypothetical protein